MPEIEADPRLRMLLAALLFYFYVTFALFHGVPAFSTAGTDEFNFVPAWPFEGLRWLIVLDPFWADVHIGALAVLSLAGVLLALAERSHGATLILAFLFPNALYYYLSELRMVHNYHHIHLILAFMFLISRSKLFFVRLALLCCYLDAGFAKLTPSWLHGEAFNSVPDKLPLLPKSEALVTLAGRALIGLEFLGPFLWFARRKALRLLSVALFAGFHLYSCVIVGFLYPAIMFSTLLPAFLGFDRPMHAGYRFSRRHIPSWVYAGLLVLGGFWSIAIPGSVLLTAEGKYFGLFMFEANRGASFRAEIAKGGKRMVFEVERRPRMAGVGEPGGGWGSARGTLYRDGKPPEALDAMGLVREEGVVIWNPQLFSAGDTVVFGDPFIYYFYGKELCRRYKPDRLDLRLHSRLNRRAKDYKVLDIQDFCRVDPSYNPFWRNPWILAPPL